MRIFPRDRVFGSTHMLCKADCPLFNKAILDLLVVSLAACSRDLQAARETNLLVAIFVYSMHVTTCRESVTTVYLLTSE